MNTPDDQDAIETLVRAIPVALKRAIVEIKATAQATAAHVGRLAAYAKARWRARALETQAFDANVELGHRMAELGVGDAEQRDRIARHQVSIHNLQAGGRKTRRAAVEVEAQEAKLAQIELERGTTAPEAETEYVAAVSARETLKVQQDNVALRRAAVRPANRAHALRLVAGYSIVCLPLAVLIVAPALQPEADVRLGSGDPTAAGAGTSVDTTLGGKSEDVTAAAAAPRPTPQSVSQAEAEITPAVETYCAHAASRMWRLSQAIGGVADLSQKASQNPALFLDDDWRSKWSLAAAELRDSGQSVGSIDPVPAEMQTTDAILHQVCREAGECATLSVRGVDRLDATVLQEAAARLQHINALFERIGNLVKEANGGNGASVSQLSASQNAARSTASPNAPTSESGADRRRMGLATKRYWDGFRDLMNEDHGQLTPAVLRQIAASTRKLDTGGVDAELVRAVHAWAAASVESGDITFGTREFSADVLQAAATAAEELVRVQARVAQRYGIVLSDLW